jgi:uncharacterized Ntn-hydrolase superfamily protein
VCYIAVMAEVSNELIYKLMLEIQAGQEALSAKVGTIASSMVSITKRLDDLDQTTRLIAVAVDDHTHRLRQIEKKLDLTHA